MRSNINEISALDLLYRLELSDSLPFLLDVRTPEERGSWKIESSRAFEELNISYIDFIEAPDEVIPRLPRDREIVVLCGKGGASAYVAKILRAKGFDAKNITGGMKSWGAVYRSTLVWMDGKKKVVQVNRVGKGCLSYIIVSEGEAAVIDPARHIGQYVSYLLGGAYQLKYVFDTHLHADHISGAARLSAATGAGYYISGADAEGGAISRRALYDRAYLELGGAGIEVMAISSPGHTPGSFLLLFDGKVLFTGDTLFVSSMGRPDLGGKAAEWVRDLWKSVRKLGEFGDGVIVLPSHTSGAAEQDEKGRIMKTLGQLRRANELLTIGDEEAFTGQVLKSIPEEPEAYQKIRKVNLGLESPGEEEQDQLELGRNRCALEAAREAAEGGVAA